MGNSIVIVERKPPIGIVRMNRPEKLNALNTVMLDAVANALETLDADEEIHSIIITGSERVFAAGADIKAMSKLSPMDVIDMNTLGFWKRMWNVNKPLIAAVSGYAYGAGCELAMLCDIIIASESARFAHPEIKLGVMPGAGGTQRLTKAIGPYRAMELILTGEPIRAHEAFEFGLVNRVIPIERYLDEAIDLARQIAERPPIAVKLARQAVRYGNEHTLSQGLEVERRNFTLLFDTADQKEGMLAFLEKRKPNFKGE